MSRGRTPGGRSGLVPVPRGDELPADGRYDEIRGGRPHAYQDRFWIDGDRIDYLDDLGFCAYGKFEADELHHAGYVMKRS